MIVNLPISRIGEAWSACRKTRGDWTVLHSAIAEDDGDEIVRMHGEERLELNLVDCRKRTPCMLAVEMCSMNALRSLILCGADTSVRGTLFMNALDMAVYFGNTEATNECLGSGNHSCGDTCRDVPCASTIGIAVASNQPKILDALLDSGCIASCIHSRSPSPIDLACVMGRNKVLEVLLKYPSRFSATERTSSLEYPLFMSLKASPFTLGHLLCFKRLLDDAIKEPTGLFDSRGEHAIHVALKLDRSECLEELLSRPPV